MNPEFKSLVKDEDNEVVGEVWYLPEYRAYRAWALCPEVGQSRLNLHATQHDAENEIRRFWGMAQRTEMTAEQAQIQERIHNPARSRRERPILIDNRDDLVFFASEIGMRLDWHEPDEQDLTALVFGQSFDNAGRLGHGGQAWMEEERVKKNDEEVPEWVREATDEERADAQAYAEREQYE